MWHFLHRSEWQELCPVSPHHMDGHRVREGFGRPAGQCTPLPQNCKIPIIPAQRGQVCSLRRSTIACGQFVPDGTVLLHAYDDARAAAQASEDASLCHSDPRPQRCSVIAHRASLASGTAGHVLCSPPLGGRCRRVMLGSRTHKSAFLDVVGGGLTPCHQGGQNHGDSHRY
jgi:hypothetical protein